jgi:hypothetical protein
MFYVIAESVNGLVELSSNESFTDAEFSKMLCEQKYSNQYSDYHIEDDNGNRVDSISW